MDFENTNGMFDMENLDEVYPERYYNPENNDEFPPHIGGDAAVENDAENVAENNTGNRIEYDENGMPVIILTPEQTQWFKDTAERLDREIEEGVERFREITDNKPSVALTYMESLIDD